MDAASKPSIKTRGTCHTLAVHSYKEIKMSKIRNLVQVHCWNRKSGAHEKTNKAKRANDKIKMKKEYIS